MYVHEVWWYDTSSVSSEFSSVYDTTITRQASRCVSSPSVPCMGNYLDSTKNSDGETCTVSCSPCYSNPSSCISCSESCSSGCYDFLNPKCVECSSTCLSCDSTTLQCSCDASAKKVGNICVCPVETIQTSDSPIICTQDHNCPDTCVCDADFQCASCHDSSDLNSDNTACECPTGYYESISDGLLTCIQDPSCPSKCICSEGLTCTGCVSHANLVDGLCECDTGYVEDPSDSNACVLKADCEDGQYVDAADTCQTCRVGCETCSLDDDDDIVCDECEDEYYLDTDQICQPCPDSCVSCRLNDSNTLECDECGSNLYIQPAGSATLCDSICPDSYYTNQSGNWSCQPCLSNCKTCTNSLSCQECISGYKSSECDDCEDEYYLDTDQTCQPCPDGCVSCILNDNDDIVCDDCVDEYYLDTDQICQPCPDSCVSCRLNDSNTLECDECSPSLYIQPAGSATLCDSICPDSYYANQSGNWSCQPCLSNCKTCTNSLSCQECISGYNRLKSENNYYGCCSSGSYFDGTSCLSCSSNCYSCSNPSSCRICNSNFYLQPSGSDKICVSSCYDEYFSQNTSIPQCISCIHKCKSCSNASECSECIEGYYLYTHESNYECRTDCPEGYYKQDLPTKSCIKCEKANCKSCEYTNSQLICIECEDGYELISNNCELCTSGTYFSNNKCEPCPELCSICTSSACSACVSSAILQDNSCKCDLGKIQSSNSCISDPNLEPLALTATVISSDTILLQFNQNLLTSLQSSDIYLVIDDVTYTSQYFNLEQVSGSSSSYRIIFKNLNLKSSKIIIVNLSNPSEILSESGATIEQNSITIEQNMKSSDSSKSSQSAYLASDPQAEAINSKGSATTKAATSGAAAMGVNVSTGLWNFINTLQLISFIPMLNIDLPITLFAVFSALRGYSPIPNLFSYMINEDGVKPYEKALVLGYDTTQFLINCGEMLSAFFIFIALYPILFCIKKIIAPRYAKSFIHTKLLVFLQDYHWNFFSRYFIESYMEIVVATLLQVIYAEEVADTNTANLYINLIFSLIALLMIFILPGVIAYFIYINRKKLENEEFIKVWGSLFEEFSTHRLSCYMYYIWFMLRRLAISLCFVFLRCCPEVQVSFASVLSWMYFIYVAYCRPFKKRYINILNIVIEFNIAACYTLVAFYLLDLSDSVSDGLQWIIITLILASILANIVSMLYVTIPDIVKLVRKCRRKNKAQVQVLPEEIASSEITKNDTTYLGDDDVIRSTLRCLDISTIQREENTMENNNIEPYTSIPSNPIPDIDITQLYEERLKEVSTPDITYINY